MNLDIEKYLKKNRLRLDAEQPYDDRIWNEIRKEIQKEKTVQSNWFWKIAAVFLFGVLITYIVVKESTKQQVVIVTLADVSKELGQQEAELKLIADKKWEELQPISAKEKSQFQFLFDELNELDNIYKTYEKDLYTVGENEQIINVLLDYYEKKIRILNRLSLEIQKQKNNENTITL
jgi:hypothetical protein